MLCYHRIEDAPVDRRLDQNFVSPSRFASHLAVLARWGFTGVTVRDVTQWQRGERELPARPIAITFDDAYASVEHNAIPLLAARNWKCTVFVVSSCLGRTNVWDADAPRATLLDAHALRVLHNAGHEIGSHSRHHKRITTLSPDDAIDELRNSRTELEHAVGVAVTSFAFPYGTHNPLALTRVRDAGYHAACTLKRYGNPRNGNSLRMGRMGIGGPLSDAQLTYKMLKLMLTPARR